MQGAVDHPPPLQLCSTVSRFVTCSVDRSASLLEQCKYSERRKACNSSISYRLHLPVQSHDVAHRLDQGVPYFQNDTRSYGTGSSGDLVYAIKSYRGRKLTASLILNPLNPELNPICCLLALLGANHFLHVSRIRVKSLNIRVLMSYIYGAPILDVSRSHTTTQHSR